MSDDEPLVGVGQAPYTEHFQGHTIEVRQLDGARPWAVWVDGEDVEKLNAFFDGLKP